MITFRGRKMTVKEAARLAGISRAQMHARIAKGPPLDAPSRRGGRYRRSLVEVRGQTVTVAEAAKIVGISKQAMHRRIADGREIDAAPWETARRCVYCGKTGHTVQHCTEALTDLLGAVKAGIAEG